MNSADDTDLIKRPQNWPRTVRAAGYIYLGFTQKQAANAAGVSERSIRDWKKCSWWADAIDEFRAGPLYEELQQIAMLRLFQAMAKEKDTATAKWLLERADPRLSPPVQKAEVKTDQNINTNGGFDIGALPDEFLMRMAGMTRANDEEE